MSEQKNATQVLMRIRQIVEEALRRHADDEAYQVRLVVTDLREQVDALEVAKVSHD